MLSLALGFDLSSQNITPARWTSAVVLGHKRLSLPGELLPALPLPSSLIPIREQSPWRGLTSVTSFLVTYSLAQANFCTILVSSAPSSSVGYDGSATEEPIDEDTSRMNAVTVEPARSAIVGWDERWVED